MELNSKQYNIIFLSIISFILLTAIFNWIEYLTNNKYVFESFTEGPNNEKMDGSTSHTVDYH